MFDDFPDFSARPSFTNSADKFTGRPTRRKFMADSGRLAGAIALAGAVGFPLSIGEAFGQDPPSCPAPPTGGAAFRAGQDTRPIIGRKPVRLLSLAELTILRKAFQAMRALPKSDPRSWIQQADLHALLCNMCSNYSAQIHATWNFFPWHRAYLYYYERILGSLVGKLDTFRLPYWDWEMQRELPQPYIYPPDSLNSLWDNLRDTKMSKRGDLLPAADGTSARIAQLITVTDFATFGGDASNSGVCELDPHNLIHSDVGKENPPIFLPGHGNDMGTLGYAARDPLFFAHHANIDKLWSTWNSMAGGAGLPAGAYMNPTDEAFLNVRWSFYDENGVVVSISAADVLDQEKNLRYTYNPRPVRLRFYEIHPVKVICCDPDPARGSRLEINEDLRRMVLEAARAKRQVNLVLRGVEIPSDAFGNFAVYAIRGETRMRIGQFGRLSELNKMEPKRSPITLLLDVSKAAADLVAKEKPAELRAVAEGKTRGFALKAETAELRVEKTESGSRHVTT